ncbi:DUF6291 domain-containing protein [Elizabethkingia ursingii]
MSRESFIFYGSWVEAVRDLPNEVRLEIYDGIMEYAISGKCPDFKPMAKIAFNFIKNDIDRANQKYEERIRVNRENGSKGGRPKKPKETQNNPLVFSETQQNPNKNDNEYDNDILLEKESKGVEIKESVLEEILDTDKHPDEDLSKKVALKKVFRIPSVQEVQDYCNERDNGISGYAFVNFYQAKGWMVGKNKMKDWQAAIRTWEQTRKENGHNQTTSSGAGNKGSVQANQVQRRNNQFTIDDFTVPS